jgi:hypothetical protein
MIFFDYREAVETFLRMGFEFKDKNSLICNDLLVTIRSSVDTNICVSSVERIECKQVQNKPLNPAPVDNAVEVSTQRVGDS